MGIRKDQIGKALGVTPVVLAQTTTPTLLADKVQVYAKDVAGIAELCIVDDVGNEVQITSNGAVNGGGGGGTTLLDNWWNTSSNDDGTFTGSDLTNNTSFAAEWNRINKWDGGTGGIVATLPLATSADHNRVLSFFEANDSAANQMTILTQGGQTFRYPGSGGGGPGTIDIGGGLGARSYVWLQYDASTTQWTVLMGTDFIVGAPI